MAYTAEQINQFIADKGIADNPYAIHNFALQYGVDPAQIDAARGFAQGTSQGWRDTNINANPSITADKQASRQFAENDPHKAYAMAKAGNWNTGQTDYLYGLNPGQSNDWASSMGLDPFAPSRTGPSSPKPQAQAATGANPYMGATAKPQAQPLQAANPYAMTAPTQPPGPAPGKPQGANPYMQSNGMTPPWANANPATQWMAGQMSQGITDHLQRNLMPGIRSAASMAGGLGGSRQGIAEGIAVGDAAKGLSTGLAGLYGGQFNQDRNYGLQNDALDLNVYNSNQNWMRQGQQDQLGMADKMLGWNQNYGVGNATQVQNTPIDYWKQFTGGATQTGGMGGSTSQSMQGNPWLSGLGGWMAGGKLFGG